MGMRCEVSFSVIDVELLLGEVIQLKVWPALMKGESQGWIVKRSVAFDVESGLE